MLILFFMVKFKVKKVREDAIIPEYAHPGDAGMDLFSCINCNLEQGQRMLIPTGLSVHVPSGYVGLIWPRSGLAHKRGVDVLAGVMDEGFRGEMGVVLLNTGYDDLIIKKGEKIAQLLIQPIEICEIEEVDNLEDSSRGEGCFGSTGGHNAL